MTSAAMYVRNSTEHQKYSTSNQANVLGQFAAQHDLQVVRIYEDNGRSGLNLAGRPALRQLLHDVLSRVPDFDKLLIYDISRWGRFQDSDEAAHYEFLCKHAGVQIIYVAEPFANDGSAVANIMKAINLAGALPVIPT